MNTQPQNWQIFIFLFKFPLDKISVTKNAFFFLSRTPAHNSFTFNLQLLYELKHMVHISKIVCGILHFRLRLVFIKIYIFVQKKSMDSLTLKHHNSFQNKNRKATHNFAPRPLTSKLQQEFWKFIDICVGWSSPKTDLDTNFLNLKNRSFENVTFSQ